MKSLDNDFRFPRGRINIEKNLNIKFLHLCFLKKTSFITSYQTGMIRTGLICNRFELEPVTNRPTLLNCNHDYSKIL